MPPRSASLLKSTPGPLRQRPAAPELPPADFRYGAVPAPGSSPPPNADPPAGADLAGGSRCSGMISFIITTNDGLASVTVNGVAHPVADGGLQGFSSVGDPHGLFHSPEVVQTAAGVYTFTLTYTLAPSHAHTAWWGSDAPTIPLAVSATEKSGATTDTIHAAMSIMDGVPVAVASASAVDEVDVFRNGNAAREASDEEQHAGSPSAEEAAESEADGLLPPSGGDHTPSSGASVPAGGSQEASFKERVGAGGAPASRFSYINQSGQAVWKEIPPAKPGNPNPSVTVSDLKGGGSLTIHKDGTYYFTAAQQPATVAPVSTIAGVQLGAALSAHAYTFLTVAENFVVERDEDSIAGVCPPEVFIPQADVAGEIVAFYDNRPEGGHPEDVVELGALQLVAGETKDAAVSTSMPHPDHDPGFGLDGNVGEGAYVGPQEHSPSTGHTRAAPGTKEREGADAGIPATDAAGEGPERNVDLPERPADASGRAFARCGGGGRLDGGIGDGVFADDVLIYVGAGDELLYGGAGHDVFVWRACDGGGSDTIQGFNLYEDKLDFRSLFGDEKRGEISETDILLALRGGVIDLTAGDATHLSITVHTSGWSQQVGLTLEGSALSAYQLDAFHQNLQADANGDAEKAALLHLILTNLGG